MKCPFCGSDVTRVIDSRSTEDDTAIRRRRYCDCCEKRFTTYEKVEVIPLMVQKKDQSREPYDRSKLEAGILRSCHKRPIAAEKIIAFIDEIENILYQSEKKEVDSCWIGELIMERLKELDPVAYVRFASVYREFKDVNTFLQELKKVLE